ncbi:MFS transporter [Anianabacter salinae]|uniref:MFS transporter n=1 Tax=Anianabacter salinae TaxID=2851023 RepID=UPI00225DDE0B|nr:MFS transporter [Anianabacter salinae]MBV0913703.1 MFS transporter [Anianabacter salinae]
MRAGLIALVAAYVLSQFYRAFLAVLAPMLISDLGVTAAELSTASGLWFAAFAAMQLPVGWALDRIGPRRTAAGLFLICGTAGAALFTLATGAVAVYAAMILLGMACSPVLMAPYYICARVYPPAIFATIASIIIGVGSLGNVAGSIPLALVAEATGWRMTMAGLTAMTLIVGIALAILVRDPPATTEERAQKGSVLDLLKLPALWVIFPIMFVHYIPAAALRGLWAGPYLFDVYGASATTIGWVTLAMSLAMVSGSLAIGPLDRLFGTRKWIILPGNAIAAVACFALYLSPSSGVVLSAVLLSAIGFFTMTYAVIIAHARSFFPAHLTGRGVTLMNLFGIAGVGLAQVATGRLYEATTAAASDPALPYRVLFAVFGTLLLLGCLSYLFSRDRTD